MINVNNGWLTDWWQIHCIVTKLSNLKINLWSRCDGARCVSTREWRNLYSPQTPFNVRFVPRLKSNCPSLGWTNFSKLHPGGMKIGQIPAPCPYPPPGLYIGRWIKQNSLELPVRNFIHAWKHARTSFPRLDDGKDKFGRNFEMNISVSLCFRPFWFSLKQ